MLDKKQYEKDLNEALLVEFLLDDNVKLETLKIETAVQVLCNRIKEQEKEIEYLRRKL